MIVRVKLFAAAKQLANAEMIAVEVSEPVTVKALRAAMIDRYPQLTGIVNQAMMAVDAEYATNSTVIPLNAEVACIPPVSGG
jgi:molybdopterin converting factor small subunit